MADLHKSLWLAPFKHWPSSINLHTGLCRFHTGLWLVASSIDPPHIFHTGLNYFLTLTCSVSVDESLLETRRSNKLGAGKMAVGYTRRWTTEFKNLWAADARNCEQHDPKIMRSVQNCRQSWENEERMFSLSVHIQYLFTYWSRAVSCWNSTSAQVESRDNRRRRRWRMHLLFTNQATKKFQSCINISK